MKNIPFHFQILIGMILGLLWGIFLPDQVFLVAPLGQIFIKLLKMIVIPLIFVSVIDGINSVGSAKQLSKLGGRTVGYYVATNVLAVLVSLFLVNIIRPGAGVTVFGEGFEGMPSATGLFDFIPKNIFEALANGSSLQIIFVAILLGVGMVRLEGKTANLAQWFKEVNALLMKLTGMIIALAPIGVFGLIASMTQALDWGTFLGIGKFAVTIILSLLVHGAIVLPILLKVFTGRSIKDFFLAARPALLTAFSTSSSSATLPLTLKCVQEKGKVKKEIAGFVLPVGATVNMDGTAMYEATACLFIAQALGIDLSLSQQLIVFFTASLAAIGAASIPSAGLITLALVLNAVGLPLEGIGFLLAIDRPLDMSRTTVNVWGDMVGCAVVQGKEKSQ